jgi:site-specific recombinase XerD
MTWQSDFSIHLVEQGRSPKTIEAYSRMIVQYAQWFKELRGKPFEPSMFVAPDLREYRTVRTQQEKAATWNLRLAALKAFAMFAALKGWVHTDPLLGVLSMQQQVPAPKALNTQEFRELRSEMDVQINGAKTQFKRSMNIRDRAIIALMAYGLLRSGEIVPLNTIDIILHEKSGEVHIRHGKGDKEAIVPLGKEVRLALADWMTVHPGTDALFPGKGTQRISQREVQRLAKTIGMKCQIDLWPHRLRHTGITRLIYEKGIALPIVQKIARHARGETTMRYCGPTNDQIQLAVENL